MENPKFTDHERLIRDLGMDAAHALNAAGQWLSTTQLLYREARRRGWTTRRLDERVVGFFAGERLVTTTVGLSTAVVGANAEAIARSKIATKNIFTTAGLPVPRGHAFEPGESDLGWEFAETLDGPVVVKPTDGSKGNGVSTGITTREQFESAWSSAIPKHGGSVLVEEEVGGLDTRAFVIAQEVVGAVTRIPPFVVGDSKHSVVELVDFSLKTRSKNAYLKKFGIRIDPRILRQQGVDHRSVLEEGRIVFLNGTNNVSQGGYSIDTTDLLDDDFKRLAVEAVQAVPNLNIAGVDLISRNFDRSSAFLIELNADAAIWLHHYPSFGKSRPVAARILDFQDGILTGV